MIPTEDLDQLVVREKVRPSLLLTALEVTGMGLGLVSRFAPKVISTNISSAVDDAAVQQFNDSIRNMQLESVDNVDVKETLKYHRELRGEETEGTEDAQAGLGSDHINAKTALSSAMYHMLKLSGKY
jgi:demethoxyubiquinone hydroxylase (CLK1/Coq7/Cat5 family)